MDMTMKSWDNHWVFCLRLQLCMGKISCFCDKIPNRSILKGEQSCVGSQFEGIQSIAGGSYGGKGYKMTHHTESTIRNQEGNNGFNLLCPFHWVWVPKTLGWCHPYSMWHFLTPVSLGKPYRCTQWCVVSDYKVSRFNNETTHTLHTWAALGMWNWFRMCPLVFRVFS